MACEEKKQNLDSCLPCSLLKQCSTRTFILCPWRQCLHESGMVPQPLPLRFSSREDDMTDSSAQSSCQELMLLQAEEPWQHLLSRKGNHWLDCSRPGEMLKTCNAPYWQAEIARAQIFSLPCNFHPELESGFMSFSVPRFLKNSQPLYPPLSHFKNHLCCKANRSLRAPRQVMVAPDWPSIHQLVILGYPTPTIPPSSPTRASQEYEACLWSTSSVAGM